MTMRDLVVGCDPMSGKLVILNRQQALADGDFIRTLVDAHILGDVRKGDATALAAVREMYDPESDEDERPFDALPADLPFSVIEWFGSDSWYMQMPLARLITEQTVPQEILDEFGQADTDYGLDYEQATWLRMEDRDAIVDRLHELGFATDDGPDAKALIQRYDYTMAH